MKSTVIILLLFWCSNLFGQIEKLKGTWISPTQELLLIIDSNDSKKYNLLGNSLLEEREFKLEILNDTLSFQFRYYSSRTDFKQLYIDSFDFKILKLTDSIIRVKPISKLSKEFFRNKDSITFTKQIYLKDTTLKFEKIIFHTSECFGQCPIYHLEIDSSKHVKFISEEIFSFTIDTNTFGYFEGKLNDTVFQKLIEALETCNLRTLRMNDETCCDGVVYTIIIYFNGQRKYYKSMMPPTIADELINVLYEICEMGGFDRIDTQFELEKE